MSDENSLGDLFATFDPLAGGTPPPLPADLGYTRKRSVGLSDRLARWFIQGRGLMLLYLAALASSLMGMQGLLVATFAVLLAGWLVAPLLGRRPFVRPARWGAALLLAGLMVSAAAVVPAWLALLPDGGEPVTLLALATCRLLERVTNPRFLLCAALGIGLGIVLGRGLARRLPWVERTPRRQPWRRMLSLSICGALVGVALALPLLHSALWNQAWMKRARSPWAGLAAAPLTPSRPADLGALVSTRSLQSDGLIDEVGQWPRPLLLKNARIAAKYLAKDRPLTGNDVTMIDKIMFVISDDRPDPALAELVWQVYRRTRDYSLRASFPALASEDLRAHVFPTLASMAATAANLKLWQGRVESLPALRAVTRENVDWAFLQSLDDLAEVETERARLAHDDFDRPLVLFGVRTRCTPRMVAADWNKSLTLLVYSHRRQRFPSPGQELSDQLRAPYSGVRMLDWSIDRRLQGITDHLPFPGFAPDELLLRAVLKLRREKAEHGRYPESYQNLPDFVVYSSDGATARLSTPSHRAPMRHLVRQDYRYFDVTLR
jgi:hypothetical protein